MAVTLEQVLEMARQLSEVDKQVLVAEIQELQKGDEASDALTAMQKLRLLDSIKFSVPLTDDASFNREDWYDDGS
jgi:hypothetical protein